MIQKVTFPGGVFFAKSFALHKVTGKFSGHCSAWFTSDGKMYDCEWIRLDGVHRRIPIGTPMYKFLESLGPIWKGGEK
jgi:hypothetical protein